MTINGRTFPRDDYLHRVALVRVASMNRYRFILKRSNQLPTICPCGHTRGRI